MATAVSAPKELLVPVIRNPESLRMPEIERKIVELATRVRENKRSLEEMQARTLTIPKGGIFRSLYEIYSP